MYELPSFEGHKTAEEIVSYLSERGLNPLRIQPLTDSKHIFTHKEWHMIAYQIRVDELAPKTEKPESENWIFVESHEAEKQYPLPSAFAAYTKYLNIVQGSGKIKDDFVTID